MGQLYDRHILQLVILFKTLYPTVSENPKVTRQKRKFFFIKLLTMQVIASLTNRNRYR